MINLANRLLFVTGAGHRLGFQFAKALLLQGASVIAHYNTDCEELQLWLTENQKYAQCVTFCKADLRTGLSIIEEVFRTSAMPLWGLINSAASFEQGNLSNSQEFESQLELNTLIPVRLSALFSEYTQEGVVLNIIDGNIKNLNKSFQSYRVSKLFLAELTRQMAFTYAPHIRVNAVAPGMVIPPIGGEDESFGRARKRAPLEMVPAVDSVIETALMLLCNPAITGEVVAVDGGVHIL